LLALGINHLTAPISIRERIAFTPEKLEPALKSLLREQSLSEVAILSTCNRTEVYCHGVKTAKVASWLADFHGVPCSLLEPHLYRHTAQAAVTHVMRVASGLDSLVIGEPQILGQLKEAVAQARAVGTIRRQLGRLFDSAFAVAKRVRAETAIGKETLSIAFAAVKLTGHIFADPKKLRVVLVGAGDTIELVAQYFKRQGVAQITIANRTEEKATLLANRVNGRGICLADLSEQLWQADVVVSATASTIPIIGKGMIEQALQKRKHKPMLLIDLAVPRDIEAQVANLSDVYLYTVDDLQSVIEDNLQSRRKAAQEAEAIIEIHSARFMEWIRAQQHLSVLREFREQAFLMRDKLVHKALHAMAHGETVENAVQRMGYELTNKLLHAPTRQLRDAAAQGDKTRLDLAAALLGIKENSET